MKYTIVVFFLTLFSCKEHNDNKLFLKNINNAKNYEFVFDKSDTNATKLMVEIPDSLEYILLSIRFSDKNYNLKTLIRSDFIKYVAISTNATKHKKNCIYLTISLIQRDLQGHSGGNFCFELTGDNSGYKVDNIYFLYPDRENRVSPEFESTHDPNKHLYLNTSYWVAKIKNVKLIHETYILPDSLTNENMEELFDVNEFPAYRNL